MITAFTLSVIMYIYATYRIIKAKKENNRPSMYEVVYEDDIPYFLGLYWGVFNGLCLLAMLALMIKYLP